MFGHEDVGEEEVKPDEPLSLAEIFGYENHADAVEAAERYLAKLAEKSRD